MCQLEQPHPRSRSALQAFLRASTPTLESNLEELNRLSHIAENIQFLAQADHAALSIECEPVALHDELAKIADYFEGLADERGRTIASRLRLSS
jgi:hypothetical protein